MSLFDEIRWNDAGLVMVIAQEHTSKRILMCAWMNREALVQTLAKQQAVYWSRSRNKLWHKGEQSGHIQKLHAVYLDCDGDALLLLVEQAGGIACHTGRESCFFRQLKHDQWHSVEHVLKSPMEIYHHE